VSAPRFVAIITDGNGRWAENRDLPVREGHSAGAKQGKENPEQNSPQGSHANPSDTRGSDSTDKEFRNNQPNASTLKGYKNSENSGSEESGQE